VTEGSSLNRSRYCWAYLEEALGYVARGEMKPRIEVFAKDSVAEAYDRVVAGDVRVKAVVTY
jgi:D-arabinose 1-dehydrogenase-like Zn-dependent alcohol dehydrogenase